MLSLSIHFNVFWVSELISQEAYVVGSESDSRE